jgi:NAD(P)-dependent dehydrogenase (short-subunit alcohol dehydrogenase family)
MGRSLKATQAIANKVWRPHTQDLLRYTKLKYVNKLAQRYPQKRVLITGATSGMGEALAMQFSACGFRVAVASRNPTKVAATCEKVRAAGGEPLAITLDVNQQEHFTATAIQVDDAWGGLDILINNAGILTAGKALDMGISEWERAINTDLWGVIHGCRHLLPLLVNSGGGHVANVASSAGLLGVPDLASYGVSKAGVVSLSESLAVELAENNIHVTVSCPTVFKSDLTTGDKGALMTGVTAEGLKKDQAASSVTSEDVAAHLIKRMAKQRMYSLPQFDARIQWFLSRLLPETFRLVLLHLYKNRLWVFSTEK